MRQVDQSLTPFVSVIIPMRNEERYIVACLNSLLTQDYPSHNFEVIVADGDSSDGSPALVASYCSSYPRIKFLPNPGKTAASGFNIGAREALGEIIIRLDAHCLAPNNFVSTYVRDLLSLRADSVGCRMSAVGVGFWGRSIALGTSCTFGVGNARYRYARTEGWNEDGWLAAYRKTTFLQMDGYDEGIGPNEDDDFFYRLIKAGGLIYRSPEVEVTYFCRDSLGKMFVQYFRYGFWKPKVILKYGTCTAVRHFFPAAFLLSVFLFGVIALGAGVSYPLIALLGLYAACNIYFSCRASYQSGPSFLFSLPIIFTTLHVAYGAGFILGSLKIFSVNPAHQMARREPQM